LVHSGEIVVVICPPFPWAYVSSIDGDVEGADRNGEKEFKGAEGAETIIMAEVDMLSRGHESIAYCVIMSYAGADNET
jgi:hypothetical protein